MVVCHSDHNRRDQLLTQFTQADLQTGEDLVGLIRDLLWRHYTGEQIASSTPRRSPRMPNVKRL
jgi:hypothetical protein